jgi:hypothetical protein
MNITGTCHFPSRQEADVYYSKQGLDKKDVDKKLIEGEIFIGKPELKHGEGLTIRDHRYFIVQK